MRDDAVRLVPQRGFDLAVMQHHNKAGGKELEIVRGSSDASRDSALRAAKKLVEQDKVEMQRHGLHYTPNYTLPLMGR